jgi:hypothetical protein
MPLAPSTQPGLKRVALTSTVVSASPNVHTITLPEYGAWLLTIAVWEANRNQMAWVTAHVAWTYLQTGSNYLCKTNVVGAAGLAGEVTGLTVSDPTTAGVLTVTLTSAHATNTASGLRAVAYELGAPSDFVF